MVLVAVALLTALIVCKGQQCDFPNLQDVENAGEAYLSNQNSEGAVEARLTVQSMTFTCLARVAFDKYSFATVVVNGTVSNSSGVSQLLQYQMMCNNSNSWVRDETNSSDPNISSTVLHIETDFQCYECAETDPSTPNYNATTDCLYCNPYCLGIGGGFCTGETADDCCPFFHSYNGACVENCSTIHPNFGPDESYTCTEKNVVLTWCLLVC